MRGLKFLVLVAVLIWSASLGAATEPVSIEVITAEAGRDQRTNEPIVNLKLSEKSGRLLSQITQENVGRNMHLRVDGKVVMSPVIREPILGGSLQISGRFSEKETQALVDSIKAGSKIEIELVDPR
jgi:preprotein translocase subunit SecD